jgi:hypothetical protein
MSLLLLGLDSLIVCLAIGALVEGRSRLKLAALFGLADGVAFLIGAGLGWGMLSKAASDVVEIATLILVGLYLLVVAASSARIARWPIWLLPFALIADNLTYGLAGEHTGSVVGEATAQAVSSGLLAFVGLLVAVGVPRVLPVARNVAATRVAGAGLVVAAGGLFLVG